MSDEVSIHFLLFLIHIKLEILTNIANSGIKGDGGLLSYENFLDFVGSGQCKPFTQISHTHINMRTITSMMMNPAIMISVLMSIILLQCLLVPCPWSVTLLIMSSCMLLSLSPSSLVIKHLRTLAASSQRQVMLGLYG